MTIVRGGSQIRRDSVSSVWCTAGCLVHRTSRPREVLMMSVCHGLVTKAAKRGDLIVSHATGDPFGVLQYWTAFGDTNYADVALIWVDPDKVDIRIAGLGIPTGHVEDVPFGARIRIFNTSGIEREAIIASREDFPARVKGPDWRYGNKIITYADHLLSDPQFSAPGNSGAVAVDDDLAVVGVVVAVGDPDNDGTGRRTTVITPIKTILEHVNLGEDLRILPSMPASPLRPRL